MIVETDASDIGYGGILKKKLESQNEQLVQNLVSKQIFARWQAILSAFDFDIDFIKGENNSLPDFLTREFLQGKSDNCPLEQL